MEYPHEWYWDNGVCSLCGKSYSYKEVRRECSVARWRYFAKIGEESETVDSRKE